jgi:hypothetical protein
MSTVATPAQMAANWVSGMQSPTAAAKYKAGIARVTVNPMQQAASPAAMQLYLNKVQQSVTSGKRAAALNAVPMSTWQNNSINIGANLLSSGATKATAKMTAHFQKWAPIYQQASDAAKSIPKDGTISSAMARVQASLQVLMGAHN